MNRQTVNLKTDQGKVRHTQCCAVKILDASKLISLAFYKTNKQTTNKTTTNNEQTTKIQTNQHQNNNKQTKQQNQKQTKKQNFINKQIKL